MSLERDDERAAGPPPPEAAEELFGQEPAEQALRDAYASGRLHHAWLLTGPRGIGKATLAFRFARFLLAEGEHAGGGLFAAAPTSLALSSQHPVFRRVAAAAHADLRVVRRAYDDKAKRLRSEIVVDDIRNLGGFFTLTAGEGSWRVAIVDAADDLNRNAANAVLKVLEEPPARGVLILVAHAPGRLLPTIRSRCRRLALQPLPTATIEGLLATSRPDLDGADRTLLARVAEGSAGRAFDLAAQDGLDLLRGILAQMARLPGLDMARLHDTGDRLARRGNEAAYATFVELLLWWLGRFIRGAAGGGGAPGGAWLLPEEAEAAARLAGAANLDQWIEVWDKLNAFAARADALSLDRKLVILVSFSAIAAVARGQDPHIPE